MSTPRDNCFIGFPNLVYGLPDVPVTVGSAPGNWIALGDCALANVLSEDLGAIARTADADPARTWLDLDLGAEYDLWLFGLRSNMDRNGEWRVQVGSAPGSSDRLDSGLQPAHGLSFALEHQEAESLALFEGIVGSDYTQERYMPWFMPAERVRGRYVRFLLVNPGHAAGQLDVALPWVSDGMQPNRNMAWGAQYGWADDESQVVELEDGSVAVRARPQRRTVDFSLPFMSGAEAELQHEMLRAMGTGGHVAWVPNRADHAVAQRFGMLGTLSALPALTLAKETSAGYRIEEV